jgi:DNA processing protein
MADRATCVARLAIVSGLARRVDAIAHRGATAVGGRAIKVLGTGIDVCYPENKLLYEKVLERGAIGSHPAPKIPDLERIIAGMPIGVIIVPGNVTQDVSFAPNLLLDQGAELVTNAEVVIEASSLSAAGSRRIGTRNLLVADGLSAT